jgi:alkylhydroperoxidase family enzyme
MLYKPLADALVPAGRESNQKVVMQMPSERPAAADYMRSFSKTINSACPRQSTLAAQRALNAAAASTTAGPAMSQAAALATSSGLHGTNVQVRKVAAKLQHAVSSSADGY